MIMDEQHNNEIDKLQKLGVESANIPELNKELIATFGNKVKCYFVEGDVVRDKFNTDFMGGGHWLVYDFIPKDEIWVERMRSHHDEVAFEWHELFEVFDMLKNNKEYEEAHLDATRFEQKKREEREEKERMVAASIQRLIKANCQLSLVLAKKKKKKVSKRPKKVIEIADALRRDNPEMSDETAYKIAWSNYRKNVNPNYKERS